MSTINPVFDYKGLKPITQDDLEEDLESNEQLLQNRVLKSTPKPTEENWKAVLETLKINPNQNYTGPPTCIEFEDNGELCRFASLGNFSAVIGKAKSRKTFFISLLLKAVIDKEQYDKSLTTSGEENHLLF